MSTPFSEELLSAYLDGELSPEEKEQVEHRLLASPELRDQLEDLAELSRRLQASPSLTAPEGFREGILLQVAERSPGRRPLLPQVRGLSRFRWAAAAVVVALVVMLADSGRNELPPDRPVAEQERQAAPAMEREALPLAAPALDSGEPETEETFPVKVVALSQEQIQQKLAEIGRPPEPGEAHFILDQAEGIPLLVEYTVVDVMDSMNQVQVLVRKQAVHAVSGMPVVTSLDDPASQQLTAVYLELDENQMAEVLHDVPALDAVAYVDSTVAAELSRSAESVVAQETAGLARSSGGGDRSSASPGRQPATAEETAEGEPVVQNFDFDLLVRQSERTGRPAGKQSLDQENKRSRQTAEPAASPESPSQERRGLSLQPAPAADSGRAETNRSGRGAKSRMRAILLFRQQGP